jgi:hypothetical protein
MKAQAIRGLNVMMMDLDEESRELRAQAVRAPARNDVDLEYKVELYRQSRNTERERQRVHGIYRALTM